MRKVGAEHGRPKVRAALTVAAALSVGTVPVADATAASAAAGVTAGAAYDVASVPNASRLHQQPAGLTTGPVPTLPTWETTGSSRHLASSAQHYVAKVNKGNVQSLVVASRTTGAVIRTVASGKVVVGLANVFDDVDLAPDGTVWAVQRRGGEYGATLVKYAPGKRGVRYMPYVVASRVSPDGRRLAVTVVSPDADHDGKGTTSVRVGPVGGGRFTTLGGWTFMVDRKTGDPIQQYAPPIVAGWVGNSSVVVHWGCCDEGNVAIIPATGPTSPTRWKAMGGDGSTQVVGLLSRGRVLVLRDKGVGDGIKVPLRTVGREALSLSATGSTRLLWSGWPKDDSDRAWARLTDAAVAATGAVPLVVSRVRFPFKGTGFVTAAYI